MLAAGTNIYSRLDINTPYSYMKTARINHEQSMDQGKNGNA
jgi:hypothetical protein